MALVKQLLRSYSPIKRCISSVAVTSARITVKEDPSLADEPVKLEVSGLRPSHEVTLHAFLRQHNNVVFESIAHYISDDQGCISLDKHKSVGGDYKGVEPMGLFSFMRPSPLNKRKYERFLIKDPKKPFNIDFRVLEGFVSSLDDNDSRLQIEPNLTITRTYMAPGVQEIPVWDGRVRATLYIPNGKGPFPGVISVSGGYPGAMKHKAAVLANHGFATLALKYFGEDDLGDEFFSFDIGYIEEAVMYMINHDLINGKRGVGVVANCYGATLCLAAASVMKPGCIRCIASTNGWGFPMDVLSYHGKQVNTGKLPIHLSSLSDDNIRIWNFKFPVTDSSLDLIKKSLVPFYDCKETSYLFIAGEKDGYVPSTDLANVTQRLLEDANHPDFDVIFYKEAGHLIEHSFYPLADVAWTFKEPHFNGGEQPGHSIAQNDSWPKILEFIKTRLSLLS